MPFDPDLLNPTKRFIWPQSDEMEEEWVELRIVPDEVNRDFFKQIGVKPKKQIVFDPKTRQPQFAKDFDLTDDQTDKFFELVTDYTIVNWHLVTPDGSTIPCTREAKFKFMKQSPQFANWINECLESIRVDLKLVKEEEEKN